MDGSIPAECSVSEQFHDQFSVRGVSLLHSTRFLFCPLLPLLIRAQHSHYLSLTRWVVHKNIRGLAVAVSVILLGHITSHGNVIWTIVIDCHQLDCFMDAYIKWQWFISMNVMAAYGSHLFWHWHLVRGLAQPTSIVWGQESLYGSFQRRK